jgi:hypothetical protein
MANIRRENSPPDATCANGCGAIPLFALNRISIESIPVGPGVTASLSMLSLVLGIPKEIRS